MTESAPTDPKPTADGHAAAPADSDAWVIKLSAALDELLDLPSTEAERRIDAIAIADAALAERLRQLFSQSSFRTKGSLLDDARLKGILGPQISPDRLRRPGDAIGQYELIAKLGKGGMGEVWSAKPTSPQVNRQVALKLTRAHDFGERAAARLVREAQLLSRLVHPNIARLYDAGMDRNQPFLVMELVEGKPITVYCAEHRLTLRARVALFQQVLAATQAAHSQLTIHRDLKPANILVTEAGEVKLLDFGIAKLSDQSGDSGDNLTQLFGRAHTPMYASPEQIRGAAVGTASDIYSLGVILYELLTGLRPYAKLRDTATTPDATTRDRIVLEDSPTRPSQSPITDRFAQSTQLARKTMQKTLADGLDAVILTALAKEPLERYATVNAMAEDLQSWLDGRAVKAHPPSRSYLMRKFFKRHRTVSAVVLASSIAVLVALAVALWQWRVAGSQATRAIATKDYLVNMFAQIDPELNRGKDPTVYETIMRSVPEMARTLKDQPETLTNLRLELGATLNQLGKHKDARELLAAAKSGFESLGQTKSFEYFQTLFGLNESDVDLGRLDDVKAIATQLLNESDAVNGKANFWRSRALDMLAWAANYQGDAVEAERLSRQALASHEAFFGKRDGKYFNLMATLIEALIDQGKLPEAYQLAKARQREEQDVPDARFQDKLVSSYTVARLEYSLNRFDDAIVTLEPLVRSMDRLHFPSHPRVITARNMLANALASAGYAEEGLAVQRENVRIVMTKGDEDLTEQTFNKVILAKLLLANLLASEAEPLLRRAVAFYDKEYAEPTWHREGIRSLLAESLLTQHKFAEALTTHELARTNTETLAAHTENPLYATTLQGHALTLLALGQQPRAQATIDLACAIFGRKLEPAAMQRQLCDFYRLVIASGVGLRAEDAERVKTLAEAIGARFVANDPRREALRAMLKNAQQSNERAVKPDQSIKPFIWPVSLHDATRRRAAQ